MQVKRYEAVNIQEALSKIKKDLGPDAIVLSTKRLPGGGGLMEVMAARDEGREREGTEEGKKVDWPASSFREREIFDYFNKELGELKTLVRGMRGDDLCTELAGFKDSLNIFADLLGASNSGHEGGELSRIYRHLVNRGISRVRACRLVEQMKREYPPQEIESYEKGLEIAQGLLRGTLAAKTGRKGRIKVFLGPTGVGKTTTLAKLAARYALEKKLRVGLITMDTYRIAAPEQLKIYARIMDLPLEVAAGGDEFRQSLDRFQDKDVILVDTPGRSRREVSDYLPRLKNILSEQKEVEINLLLSLTSSRKSLGEVALRFQEFDCHNLIFTKLDECSRYGLMVDLVEQTDRPVSYITTGQNVPRDIEQASPGRLAELVVGH